MGRWDSGRVSAMTDDEREQLAEARAYQLAADEPDARELVLDELLRQRPNRKATAR